MAPVLNARADLDVCLIESEVFWGQTIREKAKKLFGLQVQLLISIENYIDGTRPQYEDSFKTATYERNKEMLFARGDETKDQFLQQLLEAVGIVEREIRPYIKIV
jgi:hypothetical protein